MTRAVPRPDKNPVSASERDGKGLCLVFVLDDRIIIAFLPHNNKSRFGIMKGPGDRSSDHLGRKR